MESDAALILSVIVVTTFLGGVVKGATNMGLNLLAVPALAPLIGVPAAVLTIFLSKSVSDVVLLIESRGEQGLREGKRVTGFLAAGLLGALAGTFLLASLDRSILFLVLGVSLILYVALDAMQRPIRIPPGQEKIWAPIAGGASGLSQGLTGAAGPTTAIYMMSLDLTPREFIFLTSVIFLAIDAGQVIGIVALDLYDGQRLLYAGTAFMPVMLGTWLGMRLRRRLSSRGFRNAILALMFVMGLNLLRLAAGF